VVKDATPFAAACWRYGRALAVGCVREEDLMSDADLACFVVHHGCAGSALQGERLTRLLSLENQFSSLAAALKTQAKLGSRRKKDCTALMDVLDMQRPTGSRHNFNGCAHDWDTSFSRLGWVGSWNPTRSTACQWKKGLQQQQGMCRAMGRRQSVSKHACDVQEALDGGTTEEFTGLTGDTWSIDTITLLSLHLMSIQNRSKQQRTGSVNQSSPGELDAASGHTALAVLNNSGSGSWQVGSSACHDGR